jgi:hypothetical protein
MRHFSGAAPLLGAHFPAEHCDYNDEAKKSNRSRLYSCLVFGARCAN